MFSKTFGNITIQSGTSKKRGMCLCISQTNGQRIFLDYCGMDSTLVPDGSNAYIFGNKLIVVTRWSDMTDFEKQTVETGTLVLAAHPYDCMQFSLKVANNWGDVFVTLPHCYTGQNDETARVDEIIFVFSDTHDENYVISRSVTLPDDLGLYFQAAILVSHETVNMDGNLESFRRQAKADPNRDFCDFLYDACWNETAHFSEAARRSDPENIPDGVYISVNGNNAIIGVRGLPGVADMQWDDDDEDDFCPEDVPEDEEVTLDEADFAIPEASPAPVVREPALPPVDESGSDLTSDEAKGYWEQAVNGMPEAQYDLGVCYEQGDGAIRTPRAAAHWYNKAAEQGFAKAQYNLGVCYYNGFGVEEDKTRAAALFVKAAEQGDMHAQYNAGVCYYNGEGVDRDPVQAGKWLKMAAEQGHPEAKCALKFE